MDEFKPLLPELQKRMNRIMELGVLLDLFLNYKPYRPIVEPSDREEAGLVEGGLDLFEKSEDNWQAGIYLRRN